MKYRSKRDFNEELKTNENEFYKELDEEFNYTFIENEKELSELIIYPINLKLFTINFSKKFNILPLKIDNNILTIAIYNPFEYELLDRVKALVYEENKDLTIKFYLTKLNNIKNILIKIEKKELNVINYIDSNDSQISDSDIEQNLEGEVDIINLVSQIILKANNENASDIHIEPLENEVEVRFRVDDILIKGLNTTLPKGIQNELIARIKILADMDIAEKRKPQDARISSEKVLKHINKRVEFDLRVSTFPTVNGEKIVMRLLENKSLKKDLNELGMPEKVKNIFTKKIKASQGFILISGPTGSGKTTTLYSALSTIDRDKKNILTIEDPVEYRLDRVHQMQVNDKIGLTFASGLRTILRQDPNVIMVGEIRDEETAQIAVQASLTGHLVFSTIHTNDALSVITRLLEMKIKGFLLADSLTLAMAQRLVRKICKNCIITRTQDELLKDLEQYEIGSIEELNKLLGFDISELTHTNFPKGKGCVKCRWQGYLGRTGIYGYLNINDKLKDLLHSKTPKKKDLEAILDENDRQTLLESAKVKLIAQITSIDEVVRVLVER